MPFHDPQYLTLVEHVLQHGVYKPDRTGTGTYSVFDYNMRFDLRDGTIPLLTSKKMIINSILYEILWYLRGGNNTAYLNQHGVKIWDAWADPDGNLGPVYGHSWRRWPQYTIDKADGSVYGLYHVNFGEIDQIARLVHDLNTNPDSRRLIVSAWNVSELENMRLPPCHYLFQCYTRPLDRRERVLYASQQYSVYDLTNVPGDKVDEILDTAGVPKRELSLKLNQRSCDVALGVPFNIVQYSILLRMLAEVTNMAPGDFIWSGGDVHIYANHIDGLKEQLERPPLHHSPKLSFARSVNDIDLFDYDDFVITGYNSHPRILFPVAV